MPRALVGPADDAHYPKVTLPALARVRVEMRVRNFSTVLTGSAQRILLGMPIGSLRLNDFPTFCSFFSLKAGENANTGGALQDPVFHGGNPLPRFYEFLTRFQFDPDALRYSWEFWSLTGDRYIQFVQQNGVGGVVVTAAAIDAGDWAIGNAGFGANRLGANVDFCRLFNTNVALNSAPPVVAAPAAGAVHAAWEFEDSLADVTGAHPLTWIGGGAPTYEDSITAPSAAPVLTSAVYTAAPDRVDLVFTSPNAGGEAATWVDVERKVGAGGDWRRLGFTTNAGATTFRDAPVKHGVAYYYRVKARNRIGSSAYSNVIGPVNTGAGVDTNPTIVENAKTGTSDFLLVSPATAREIEGYCDLASYQKGDTVNLKVNSLAGENFNLEVFRLGYYAGAGARRIRNVLGIAGAARAVPAEGAGPRYEMECNWATTYALSLTDADATEWPSGVYIMRLTQVSSGKQCMMHFCIRDDSRRSEFMFNEPVMTWQAYNHWPNVLNDSSSGWPGQGRSTYVNQAATVCFNRPHMKPATTNSDFALGSGGVFVHPLNTASRANQLADEVNYLRWLEANGYDVQYCTDLDLHQQREKIWARCAGILFPSHTEYVSLEMRDTVIAAREYGRHLGFFGANQFYWQVRIEPGPVTGQADRMLVCYKQLPDPYNLAPATPEDYRKFSIRWQDLGGTPLKPEQFLGVGYQAGDFGNDPYVVTAAGAAHPLLAGTGLAAGESIPGLVGYEFDMSNGLCDYPVTILSHTSPPGSGVGDADSVVYSHPNGALVFAAGTMQLAWALDDFGAPAHRVSRLNAKIAALVTNILAVQRQATIAEVGSGPVADRLAMQTQPTSPIASGAAHAVQPVVRIADAGGATVVTDTSVVTAALVVETGAAAAIGNLNKAAVAGVADFAGNGLGATSVGGATAHWHFTDGALLAIDSATFTITGSGGEVADHLAMQTQPSSPVASGVPHAIAPVVRVAGASGATIATDTSVVTAALIVETGAAVAMGNPNKAAINGVADFTSNGLGAVSAGGATAHWQFTRPGLPAIISATFTVTPPAAPVLTDFLVIGPHAYEVIQDTADEDEPEYVGDPRKRTHKGNLRTTVRAAYRRAKCTIGPLTPALVTQLRTDCAPAIVDINGAWLGVMRASVLIGRVTPMEDATNTPPGSSPGVAYQAEIDIVQAGAGQ